MISGNFYRRYQLFLSSNPLFSRYIRWVYRKTLRDFEDAGMPLRAEKKEFTALLCGTCGEITSSIFVEHILKLNPEAHVIILDLGKRQVEASKERIQKKFPRAKVSYVVADARQSELPAASIDFIDTDFMFEYLDAKGIEEIFAEWRRILKPGGQIAFRAFGTSSWFSRQIYKILIKGGCRLLLKSDVFDHSLASIETCMKKYGFRYNIAGKAFLPFGYRFVAELPQ